MRPIDVVALRGGLGNQLFAWAYGRGLELDGRKVRFSFTAQHGRRPEIAGLIGDNLFPVRIADGIWRRISRIGDPDAIPLVSVIEEDRLDMTGSNRRPFKKIMFHWGYWQSASYFAEHQAEIRRQVLSWIKPDDSADDERWCAVHVRRGDYVTDSAANSVMGVLGDEYYLPAIEAMHGRGFSRFRFFSDDRSWVEQHWLDRESGGLHLELAPPGSGIEDLRGLAACGGVITANSTFSWWGAFLGPRDRAVVAPRRWFANDPVSSARIVPSAWISI